MVCLAVGCQSSSLWPGGDLWSSKDDRGCHFITVIPLRAAAGIQKVVFEDSVYGRQCTLTKQTPKDKVHMVVDLGTIYARQKSDITVCEATRKRNLGLKFPRAICRLCSLTEEEKTMHFNLHVVQTAWSMSYPAKTPVESLSYCRV